ncbi:MAG TPA: hypothetical protein VLK33_03055, partial [Terriglobales bacterium]|nr:hypothetical protein [Terriglobales bacterium]
MNMRLLISTLFCSFILLLPVLSFAQDQDDTNGWSVDQRCAAQAITPPDDWKFDGTIFTWDWDGIRAVNAAIPTPYFVLFDSEFMEGAALSPDGRWYAIPDGFGVPANVSETEFWYEIRKIHFYSTDGRREHHDIPWEMTFRPYVNKIVWLDNDHIAYPAGDWVHYRLYSVDHMTGEQTLLNLPTVSNGSTFRADPLAPTLSPDHTRYVADGNLIEVATGNTIIQLFENTSKPMQTLWTPDSAYFISADGTLAGTENTTHAISLYNRDGDFLNTIALFQGIFFDLAMSP